MLFCNRLPPLVLLVVFGSSCGPRGPDSKSGPDAERHKAKKMELGQPASDRVSYPDRDRTDWKVLEILDSGVMVIELMVDNPKAEVEVTVYNRYGQRLPSGRLVRHKDDAMVMRLMVQVDPGRYFIRVRALHEGDSTGYQLTARLQ